MLRTEEINLKKDPIVQLLFLQLTLFLAFQLLAFIGMLWQGPQGVNIKMEVVRLFAMPYDLGTLAWKPWTLFTSLISHEAFFHFLFNGLFLFFIGRMYLMLVDSRSVWPLFICSGLAGNMLSLLLMQSPGMQPYMGDGMLLGSSGALMGMMMTLARIHPNLPVRLLFFGEVKLKFVALAYLLLNVLMLGSSSNLGGTLAHLGGASLGLWYGWRRSQGQDPLNWMYFGLSRRKGTQMKVSFRKPESDEAFRSRKAEQEFSLDELLDKVHRKGLDSLSKKERQLLDKYSGNS